MAPFAQLKVSREVNIAPHLGLDDDSCSNAPGLFQFFCQSHIKLTFAQSLDIFTLNVDAVGFRVVSNTGPFVDYALALSQLLGFLERSFLMTAGKALMEA